jgi:hypothetical protein
VLHETAVLRGRKGHSMPSGVIRCVRSSSNRNGHSIAILPVQHKLASGICGCASVESCPIRPPRSARGRSLRAQVRLQSHDSRLCAMQGHRLLIEKVKNDTTLNDADSIRCIGVCSTCQSGCTTRPSRMVDRMRWDRLARRRDPVGCKCNRTPGRDSKFPRSLSGRQLIGGNQDRDRCACLTQAAL